VRITQTRRKALGQTADLGYFKLIPLYLITVSSTDIYNLGPRRHFYSLTVKKDCRNYTNRLLQAYKDIY